MATPGFDASEQLKTRFQNYWLDGAFDEMFEREGVPRPHYGALHDLLLSLPAQDLGRRKQAADISFLHQGITFTVYGREDGTEQIFPHDLLPRIMTSAEWETIERGLTQRITALNLFLHDIYHEGRSLAAGIVPREIVYSCKHFRRQMREFRVPRNIYVTVVGTDLVRLPDGRRPADRSLQRSAARHAARPCARGPARTEHRIADSRRVQLRVFRACLPRAADGDRAGGRPRS